MVDGSKTGSITVHKYERPATPTNLPNNGTQVPVAGLNPLAGIEFTVQKVNTIDLATNAGWQSANTLNGVFDPANPAASITSVGFTLGTGQAKVSAADGTAAGTLPSN